MSAVLMSIRPQWCELIASGEKTIEVRKTVPKLEIPFKVYIYCTKDEPLYQSGEKFWCGEEFGNGKVIGEFMCDEIHVLSMNQMDENNFLMDEYSYSDMEKACLTALQLYEYCRGRSVYGWHISDLVIYDNPRELREFKRACDGNCQDCKYAVWQTSGAAYEPYIVGCSPITRPPQSWCYVEEVQSNG